MKKEFDDIGILIELAQEEEDQSMVSEIQKSYEDYKKKFEELRIKTLLNGEYDSNNAIISIHAGSGGTDAQDWAEMLLRMYTRWSESKGYKVKILDYQDATEGGIKSATLLIDGENAYGYLKNEKGVHRIVRISPFDSWEEGIPHSRAGCDPEMEENITVTINPRNCSSTLPFQRSERTARKQDGHSNQISISPPTICLLPKMKRSSIKTRKRQ